MLFIYSMKKAGKRTEPWGTPELTFAEAEWELFTDGLTDVVCVRFDRNQFIRCNVGYRIMP